jgi:hypothetical protein
MCYNYICEPDDMGFQGLALRQFSCRDTKVSTEIRKRCNVKIVQNKIHLPGPTLIHITPNYLHATHKASWV